MARFVLAGRLPFLAERQVDDLNARFAASRQVVKASELATLIGVSEDRAVALLAELAGEELGQLGVVIYHDCDLDTPAIPFRAAALGLALRPWRCHLCDRMTDPRTDLSMSVAIHVDSPIDFAWATDVG